MAIDNAPEGMLAEQRELEAAFSALTKTFGAVVQVSEPSTHPDSWRLSSSSRCAHDWPGDLGEPDACCGKCGLSYAEYEV